MTKVKDKNTELEILISTMNRTSLDFLKKMFSKCNFLDFSILIINQTTENKLLISDHSTIRVINSFEKGLSKSRNLALKNAIKPICLIADDDVIFLEGFEKIIIEAHQNNKQPIITFQTTTTENKLYWKYPKSSRQLNEYMFRQTLSVEMTLKKDFLDELIYDERFGLGANFEDGENYIFLTEAKKKQLKMWFVNKSISLHKPFSSSDKVASERILYATGAINSYKYNNLAYFLVLKFVFFLLRKNYISLEEVTSKIKIGFKGIHNYKSYMK
ncbi:MAG: glycosyltransferase family A protein [Flavobacteriaceae bacterium]|nr:glycosyltransferase family A protein [Flavobacteriaceae bacterium]